jgi:hypothetical protein
LIERRLHTPKAAAGENGGLGFSLRGDGEDTKSESE